MKKEQIQKELEEVRQANNGILKTEAVVEYAKNPETAMHSWFTWDDSEAAHNYRIWQARQLIRVVIKESPKEDLEPMRVYVSMLEDRYGEGGGYRSMDEVLTDKELREQLIEQATKEFDRWREKYEHINDLAEVFAAMDRVKHKRRKKEVAII